jgi:hypothetical protein
MLGEIKSQVAITKEMDSNLRMMVGKNDQGFTMGGFGGVGGRTAVPNVNSRFPTPGAQSVIGVRARAAKAISESKIFGPRLVTKRNDQGELRTYHQTIDENNNPIEKDVTDEKGFMSTQHKARIGSAAQGALGRAMTGGGLGGIADIAGALIPEGPVGVAIGGAMAVGAVGLETAHMVASQRAQNAQFQSVMGGSNFSGFGQRISQARFGLTHAFTLGTGQAEQAFMGATNLGMRGTERNQALNMAVSSFNSMGMSVAQSLQAMSVQAQSGYENFGQLEQSLKDVTAAAKETSQNANTVRDSFISILGSLTSQIGGGVGTNAAAGGIASMKAGLGRQFAGVDMSGLGSQQMMFMIANNQGLNYNQALSKSITDPNFMSQGINKLQNQFVGQVAGNAPQVIGDILKQGGFKPGPGGKLSPGQVQSIADQAGPQLTAQIPAVQSMLQSVFGMNLNPQQTLEWLINQQVGNTNIPNAKPTTPQQVSQAQRSALAGAAAPGANIIDVGAAAKGTGLAGGTKIDVGTIAGTGGKNAQLRLKYLQQVSKTGINSPVVDAALKDNSNFGKLYRVNTADGAKTVSFNDLVTNYSDQLASGEATYATGSNQSGSQVGVSVSGGYGGPSTATGTAASASKGFTGKDQTKKAEQWEAKYQKQAPKQTGKKGSQDITISATPQLAQLFGFAINGQSITVQTATSLSPSSGQVNPDNLAGTVQQYGSS